MTGGDADGEVASLDTSPGTSTGAEVQAERRIPDRRRSSTGRVRGSTRTILTAGFGVIGVLAIVGGLVFVGSREVLFTLAAAGLFASLLSFALAPTPRISATVAEGIYEATATNGSALVDGLGVEGEVVYVPTDSSSARLTVAVRDDTPEAGTIHPLADGADGLVLEPTGAGLYREFERLLRTEAPSEPEPLAAALADGLENGLELVSAAEPAVDVEQGTATVTVTERVLGPVDRFDHPVASFLAVGFAAGLDRPITLEVDRGESPETWHVTCRWQSERE